MIPEYLHAHTDAVATDGCKTSGSVIPQAELRNTFAQTTGSQPQTCAACLQPTVDPRPACWVCIEQAQGFAGQMDDAAHGHEDTARIEAIKRKGNLYVGSLFIANQAMDPRDVLDLLTRTEGV